MFRTNLLQKNHRNLRIDFLRGVAIFLVLILHYHLSYQLDQSALNKFFSIDFIKTVASNGNYGVTMFFVISGFLITSMSLKRYGNLSNMDMLEFYSFRLARIMPCLLLALLLIGFFYMWGIAIFANDANTTSFFLVIFSVLTFWHNVLMEYVGYFNYCLNILWSLSVEEIFYLAFPIVCLTFRKTRFIVPLLIALIILGPIYRSYYSNNEIVALYGYFSCFDAIAMGCCAAMMARKIQITPWINKVMQYSAVILLIATYCYSGIMENVVFGISLVGFATAILLISTSAQNLNSTNIVNSIICWFGKHSYELYLFHIIVLALMKQIYTPQLLGSYSKLIWMLVFFMVSAIMAGGIAKFYSEPLNKKLRQLFANFRQRKSIDLSLSVE